MSEVGGAGHSISSPCTLQNFHVYTPLCKSTESAESKSLELKYKVRAFSHSARLALIYDPNRLSPIISQSSSTLFEHKFLTKFPGTGAMLLPQTCPTNFRLGYPDLG